MRTSPAKLFNNDLLDQVCLLQVFTCISGAEEIYLPVRRWTMLHFLLIASERGVLGLKLFYKSSA